MIDAEPSSPPDLSVSDVADPAVHDVILDGLKAFNEAQAGPSDLRPLVVAVRQGERVVGGLWGGTSRAWLSIDLLFLPEALRQGGLGARAVALAEAEARARGCVGAWLYTYSFQARAFYERLGYAVFGRLADNPPGHERLFMQKRL